MPSTQLADLPAEAVQQIISKARSRRISGTNGFATVCKTWQEASPEEDQEQLRLLVDVSQMSEEQLDIASEWLSQYGQQVVALDLCHGTRPNHNSNALQPFMKQLFQAAALREGLTHLVLYINHTEWYSSDTLGDLIRLGQQLPNLQHLEASTDLGDTWNSRVMLLNKKQLATGAPTPMQRLLPALTSLSLWLVPQPGYNVDWDALLPAVLPHTLQQLQLSAAGAHFGVSIALDAAENLAQFPQLRRLGLAGLDLYTDAVEGIPPQVEELYLIHCDVENGEGDFEPFAAKVTQLGTDMDSGECWADEGRSRKLTALHLSGFYYDEEEWADVSLAAELPQLQRLALTDIDKDLQPVAQQLCQLSSLRQLTLSGQASEGVLGALGCVTQLTALNISDLAPPEPRRQQQARRGTGRRRRGAQRGGGQGQAQAPPEPHTISSMLQQLTGLRQLSIHEEVFMEQGPWLPCLTQLTLLAVEFDEGEMEDLINWWEDWEEGVTSPEMQAWLAARPASLQHLRFFETSCSFTYTALSSPVPGLSVMLAPVGPGSCWPQEQFRLVQPCPHLPGVMEVLGE